MQHCGLGQVEIELMTAKSPFEKLFRANVKPAHCLLALQHLNYRTKVSQTTAIMSTAATPIPATEIDSTFKSDSIGEARLINISKKITLAKLFP